MADLSGEICVYILGIETSCDETAAAIYHSERGLVHDAVYSQTLHAEFGGVVPELASRDHIRKLCPMVNELIAEAGIGLGDIGAVAYTSGPGLIGALLVGAGFGYSLARALGIPSYAIHHLEGHLLSPMLADEKPEFPFLCLLVSGGHTCLVDVHGYGDYHLLGQSIDDAVGEAFDKTAKLMGLGYPGGPKLAQLATKGCANINFPKPMLKRGLDFSFSGLKTAVATYIRANPPKNEQEMADIAASFEDTVVEILLHKLQVAQEQSATTNIVVAGGVSANIKLRSKLTDWASANQLKLFVPPLKYCTDNAAMIALAGAMAIKHNAEPDSCLEVTPRKSLFAD